MPPHTTLTDGSPVTPDHRQIDPATGMQKGYVVLSAEERAKGFVEPVRHSYIHKKCGAVTTMGNALAETYARQPDFYSGTFCCGCGTHFPLAEFLWDKTDQQVGTISWKGPPIPPMVNPLTDPANACETEPPTADEIKRVIEYLVKACNASSRAHGWWHHPKEDGGAHLLSNKAYAPYVVGTKLALEASEVFEAFEGYRRGLMDDKLPQFDMLTVEQADTVIRIFDVSGELKLPLVDAILAKMDFNIDRPDHEPEARRKAGGKKF